MHAGDCTICMHGIEQAACRRGGRRSACRRMDHLHAGDWTSRMQDGTACCSFIPTHLHTHGRGKTTGRPCSLCTLARCAQACARVCVCAYMEGGLGSVDIRGLPSYEALACVRVCVGIRGPSCLLHCVCRMRGWIVGQPHAQPACPAHMHEVQDKPTFEYYVCTGCV